MPQPISENSQIAQTFPDARRIGSSLSGSPSDPSTDMSSTYDSSLLGGGIIQRKLVYWLLRLSY